MSEVTTAPQGKDHVYILVDGKWVASCLPEYKDRFAAAAGQNEKYTPSERTQSIQTGAYDCVVNNVFQPARKQTAPAEGLTRDELQRLRDWLLADLHGRGLGPLGRSAVNAHIATVDNALRSLAPQASPEWPPHYATNVMCQAGIDAWNNTLGGPYTRYAAIYRAMLRASDAPLVGAQASDGQGASAPVEKGQPYQASKPLASPIPESEAHPTPPQGSGGVHKSVIEGFRARFMATEINEPTKRQFNALCDQALANAPFALTADLLEAVENAVNEWPASSNTDNPNFENAMADLERASANLTAASAQSAAGAEAERLLQLILPLARGYAAEHPGGSNQAYVLEAVNFLTERPVGARPEPPAIEWISVKERLPDRSLADESGGIDGCAVLLESPTFDGGPEIRQAWFDVPTNQFVCHATATALTIVLQWSRPAAPRAKDGA